MYPNCMGLENLLNSIAEISLVKSDRCVLTGILCKKNSQGMCLLGCPCFSDIFGLFDCSFKLSVPFMIYLVTNVVCRSVLTMWGADSQISIIL